MRRLQIPGTTLETSRLGFGTASLHHIYRASDRRALLSTALDLGYTHFDTARMYGEGMAERSIGSLVAGGLRARVTIATKFGLPASPLFEHFPGVMYAHRVAGAMTRRLGWGGRAERIRRLSPSAAEASVQGSMRALCTDWLDILFLHEPQPGDIPRLHELVGWLESQKSSGRVRYLGLAGSAEDCVLVAREFKNVFDVLQVEDSLAESEADIVGAAGRPLQVTFGYLRRERLRRDELHLPQLDAAAVMRSALQRNPSGMILVSTRDARRLRGIAATAESEGSR